MTVVTLPCNIKHPLRRYTTTQQWTKLHSMSVSAQCMCRLPVLYHVLSKQLPVPVTLSV